MKCRAFVVVTSSLHFLQQICLTVATDYINDYEGSGREYYTASYPDLSSGACFKERCPSFLRDYCCHTYSRCCQDFLSPSYERIQTRCTTDWGSYTGTRCPPDFARDRQFCCSNGHFCCNSDQMKRQDGVTARGSDESHSGVNSIGGIAGLVFLAVIIFGTILTFITRYLKIKIRRDHAQAGINSPAYINARNMRAGGYNSNGGPASDPQHGRSGSGFHRTPPDDLEEEDDELAPPPSYAEAVATCPVVTETNLNFGAREDNARDERSASTSRPPAPPAQLSRPATRSRVSNDTAIELQPYSFKNINSRSTSENDATSDVRREDDATITIPKPDDSTA